MPGAFWGECVGGREGVADVTVRRTNGMPHTEQCVKTLGKWQNEQGRSTLTWLEIENDGQPGLHCLLFDTQARH